MSYILGSYKLEDIHQAKDFINSITIFFTAVNFQVNLFPIHSNQKDKSIKGSVKTIGISMIIIPCIYIIVSLVSILRFGNMLESSVFINIGRAYPYDYFKLYHGKFIMSPNANAK